MKGSSKLDRRDLLKAGALGGIGLAGLGLARTGLAASPQHPLNGLTPLYRASTQRSAAADQPAKLSQTPRPAVWALRRLCYGYRPEDLAYFETLGGDFDEQLEGWVNWQLAGFQPAYPPPPGSDPPLNAVLDDPDMNFETLDDSIETLWAERVVAEPDWPYYQYPLIETQYLTALRTVYSQWQLGEVLADFWHTHFSVDGAKFEVSPVFVQYDRDVIRANMLGNFRQMIEDVSKSTAMMLYLNNASNTRYGPNENYARELQELHTLGAVHSYSFTPEGDIPAATAMAGSSTVLPTGLKNGYSEQDVRQVTLCLTGWTISEIYTDGFNTGGYVYHADWHDESAKRVLGIDITTSGEDETKTVLDLLAMHPNTARYVCRKLCRRLISDDPPESIVEAAAVVFNDQWQAPDQLEQVVRTIILSSEFKDASHWGAKTKRPFEMLMGAIRSCGGFTSKLVMPQPFGDFYANVLLGEHFGFSVGFYWTISEIGHLPFTWATPDGFPDNRAAWLGSTPLIMSWRALNSMSRAWTLDDPTDPENSDWHDYMPVDSVAVTKAALAANDRTPQKIVDLWVNRFLGYDADLPATPQLDASVRNALVAFMQQDAASADAVLDLDQATWDNAAWNAYVPQRLQVLVASIGMLPDNMLR